MQLKQQMQQLQKTFRQDNLKSLRTYAHNAFDQLWKNGDLSRSEAYEWLAEAMNLPAKKAHIALFNANQCHELLNLLSEDEDNNPHGLAWEDQF